MKLIILNGCPLAGKSTIAEQLYKDFPLALYANIDAWRSLVNEGEGERLAAIDLTYTAAIAGVKAYLEAGRDVVVDKALAEPDDILDRFVALGDIAEVEVHEFILNIPKEVVLERIRKRGFKDVMASEELAIRVWELTQAQIQNRPHATVIDTSVQTKEATLAIIRGAINPDGTALQNV